MTQNIFEPTATQKASLEATVEQRYSEDFKRWPAGIRLNYSYTNDKNGATTATVEFSVPGRSTWADFKLMDDDRWCCTHDWRD